MREASDNAVRSLQVIDKLFAAQITVLDAETQEITDAIISQSGKAVGGFSILDGAYRVYRDFPLVSVPDELYPRALLLHSNRVRVAKDRKLCLQTLIVLTAKTLGEAAFRQCLPPTIVDLAGYGHIPADGLPFTRNVFNPDNIKNGLEIIDYYAMTRYLL